MNLAGLSRWLQAPPITGRLALLCAILAVTIPTAVRDAVSGVVTGCEFTPYLPFVLLSAILLPWGWAGAVSLVSVGILGGLFIGTPQGMVQECFVTSASIFLASSTLMIGIVLLIRRVFAATQLRGADESAGGIVFSSERNAVWASWYGSGPPVRLGSKKKVEAMMEDYLAQVEVARRLNGKRD